MKVKREDISAKQLIAELNDYAREVDHYEFGLPMMTGHDKEMEQIVRNWLRKRARYEQQQRDKVSNYA